MTFNDPEFGEVVIRKSAWSTNPKFSVSTSGKLTISGPKHTTVFLAKRWLNASRKQIREKLPIKDPATQRARDAQKKILAKKAKELGLDAIHDTVHEMAKDEARHGKAFEGLLNRYFGK